MHGQNWHTLGDDILWIHNWKMQFIICCSLIFHHHPVFPRFVFQFFAVFRSLKVPIWFLASVPLQLLFSRPRVPRIVINSLSQIFNSSCFWLVNFIVDSFTWFLVWLVGFSNFLPLVCINICNFYNLKTDLICLFIHICIFTGHNRDCQKKKTCVKVHFNLTSEWQTVLNVKLRQVLKVQHRYSCSFSVLFLIFFFYLVSCA